MTTRKSQKKTKKASGEAQERKLPFRNVELIKSRATTNLIQLYAAKAEYYPGAEGHLVIPRLPGKTG